MSENLSAFLEKNALQFKGNPKVLTKLLRKLDAVSHAPTTPKHTQRLLPFVQEEDLVTFINAQLEQYFNQQHQFKPSVAGFSQYDIKRTWYLFALLVYAQEVQSTVVLIWKQLKAAHHADIALIRRILSFCDNPVYHQLQQEVERYYIQLQAKTPVYQWLKERGVTPPNTMDWNFTFRLETIEMSNPPLVEKLFLTVRGFEPKGDGTSFEIELKDQQHQVSSRWSDFSTEDFIRRGNSKIPLSFVPQLDNLKATIKAIEEVFDLEFDKNYHFHYFSRGFKQKNKLQKWLLQT